MPTVSRNVDDVGLLAQKGWQALQDAIRKKDATAKLYAARGVPQDLRVDAIQYQVVHLHNLCVSLVVLKEHLLHFSWWDRYFPGIPTNEAKMMNASRFWEMVSFSTFVANFSGLESYIRRIHVAISPNSEIKSHDSFFKIRKAVFENQLAIPFPELAQFFQLMQTVRNCIHNHGVYFDSRTPKLEIRFRSESYMFIHNQPPNCVQPEFLIDRIADSVDVISQTSATAPVLAARPIEDRYDFLGDHETRSAT